MLGGAPAIGVLVGLGRFTQMAALSVAGVAFRVPAGYLLARGDHVVSGALAASLLTFAGMGVAATWLALRGHANSSKPVEIRPRRVGVDGVTGALLAGLIWGAWSLPLLAARHFLVAADSGNLAAAHLMAGGVVYITAPVLTAFFPSLVRAATGRTLAVGLVVTIGLALGASIGVVAIGPVVARRLYGGGFELSTALCASLCLSATLISVVSYLLWAARAAGRWHVATLAIAALTAGIEVLIIEWRHGGAVTIALTPAIALATTIGAAGTTYLCVAALRRATWRARRASALTNGT